MGAVFALPIIMGVLVVGIGFIIGGIACSWGAALVLLLEGMIIKLVNIKVKWRSFSVYSTVLLILGGIFGILSVAATVFGVSIITGGSNGADMSFWLFYLTFSMGMAVFTPLGTVGILLELIYRKKRKNVLNGFAVALISLASVVLAATVGIIIWLAPGIINL